MDPEEEQKQLALAKRRLAIIEWGEANGFEEDAFSSHRQLSFDQ